MAITSQNIEFTPDDEDALDEILQDYAREHPEQDARTDDEALGINPFHRTHSAHRLKMPEERRER